VGEGFLDFLDAQYPDFLEGFRRRRPSPTSWRQLKAAIADFNARFAAQGGGASA
jgi:hypothetical protein